MTAFRTMKTILITFCLVSRIFDVNAQVNIWKNDRVDTITAYIFSKHTILVSKISDAKPTSNLSFTTPNFDLCWAPVKTFSIEDFVARSLKGYEDFKILDTLHCTIIGKKYTGILFKSKSRYYSFFYQAKTGDQDFFIASKIKKNKVPQMLDFISTHLKE